MFRTVSIEPVLPGAVWLVVVALRLTMAPCSEFVASLSFRRGANSLFSAVWGCSSNGKSHGSLCQACADRSAGKVTSGP